MRVRSLGWEDPLEEEMATHSSILAWGVPWTEEPGGLQSMDHKELDMTEQLSARTHTHTNKHKGIQFSSVSQSCPAFWNPMDCSMPGFPVHHQLLEFTQTHVHRVSDAIQPSHPLSPASRHALNLS